jgi:hypothetical protein
LRPDDNVDGSFKDDSNSQSDADESDEEYAFRSSSTVLNQIPLWRFKPSGARMTGR